MYLCLDDLLDHQEKSHLANSWNHDDNYSTSAASGIGHSSDSEDSSTPPAPAPPPLTSSADFQASLAAVGKRNSSAAAKCKAGEKLPPPPGLTLAPHQQGRPASVLPPPPGLAPPGLEDCRRSCFDAVQFRKDLVATLQGLAADHNVGKAVNRIRAHQVPSKEQATVIIDLLSRGADEFCGPKRRTMFAFAVSLGSGTPSAFSREEILNGYRSFFADVYPGLLEEAPTLRKVMCNELLPMLCRDISEAQQRSILPLDLRPGSVPTPTKPLSSVEAQTNTRPGGAIEAWNNKQAFDAIAFQKDVVSLLRDLAMDRDMGKAVRRVRIHCVPTQHQVVEVSNMLVRASEESDGARRRLFFAFVCALVSSIPTPFDKAAFVLGVQGFFADAYDDVCDEVPNFSNLATHELLPSLRKVMEPKQLEDMLPLSLKKTRK